MKRHDSLAFRWFEKIFVPKLCGGKLIGGHFLCGIVFMHGADVPSSHDAATLVHMTDGYFHRLSKLL